VDVVTKILVVDSEAQLRGSLQRHLRREGYLVEAAPDTAQARHHVAEACRSGKMIDLVITGAFSPLMEGPDLIRWLHHGYPLISTILMSDFGPDQNGIPTRPGNFDEYCGRPTTPAEIRKLIARIDFGRLAARMYGTRIETV
jgi:DNA-binding response OmpR family regulator